MTNTDIEEVNTEEQDKYLLRYVGQRSTTEIAKELGMRPIEVRSRINELLESIDVLTVVQQRAKLMIQLRKLVENTNTRIDQIGNQIDDREYSQLVSAATNAIRVQLAELERFEKADNSKVEALNALRVRELLRLMDAVVKSSVAEIASTYGVDESKMHEVFQERLVQEAAALEEADMFL